MIDIANINENDRKALFQNTAAKMGMTDAIIEKDFWVCFMLDYLFHTSKWKDNIAFKGGTSLSKSYGLTSIRRSARTYSIHLYTVKTADSFGICTHCMRQVS